MYRELVGEVSSENKWVKIGAPCSEEEIMEAENFVGYDFPMALKELLREMDGDGYFLLSAKEIIENVQRNREYFTECFDDSEEYLERIGRYIFFASNGCGDYFGYRVTSEGQADESVIYMWEHEGFESHPAAKDIADLIVKYYHSEI